MTMERDYEPKGTTYDTANFVCAIAAVAIALVGLLFYFSYL